MKHVFILNPYAGDRNKSEDVRKKINGLLDKTEYIFYETKCQGDAIIFVKEFIESHLHEKIRFYACGGDGTLNEVVNGAVGYSNVEVTNYPIGSANDFLKYFGNVDSFLDLNALINGKVYQTDLLKFNDRYVLNVFNIGYDAKVVDLQRKFKKWPLVSAHGAYTLGVFFALLSKLSHKFKVTIDGEEFYNGNVTMCAVANSICYGGGFYCAPIAKIDDNILDVCVVKKVSIFSFARLANIYKQGKHLGNKNTEKYISYKQGRKINIETEKPLIYSIDGELGRSKNVVLEVIPKALNFIIPNNIINK